MLDVGIGKVWWTYKEDSDHTVVRIVGNIQNG